MKKENNTIAWNKCLFCGFEFDHMTINGHGVYSVYVLAYGTNFARVHFINDFKNYNFFEQLKALDKIDLTVKVKRGKRFLVAYKKA
jgi:hypothetical protein